MDKPPYISKELIEYLEKHFPDRMPPHTLSHQEFIRRAAEVNVVRHLRSLHEDQVQNSLQGDIDKHVFQRSTASPAAPGSSPAAASRFRAGRS